jgi:hypothetical protein
VLFATEVVMTLYADFASWVSAIGAQTKSGVRDPSPAVLDCFCRSNHDSLLSSHDNDTRSDSDQHKRDALASGSIELQSSTRVWRDDRADCHSRRFPSVGSSPSTQYTTG